MSYSERGFDLVRFSACVSKLPGQDHRCSNNFNLSKVFDKNNFLWSVPEGISFDLYLDNSAAIDDKLEGNITDGTVTSYSATGKNNVYIANVKIDAEHKEDYKDGDMFIIEVKAC